MNAAIDALQYEAEGCMSEGTVMPPPRSSDVADSDAESIRTVLESDLEEDEMLDLASSLQNLRRPEAAKLGSGGERTFAPLLEALDRYWKSHRTNLAAVLIRNHSPETLRELVSDSGRLKEVCDELFFPIPPLAVTWQRAPLLLPLAMPPTGWEDQAKARLPCTLVRALRLPWG
ncbi:unnamed protein product [Polarella glacialis]|uniref:Uncharacterized protein n=1 Tax=Polarella glacialis TaxID=89957 RepID=A0A813JQJ2_POLGL|nr:unnamed protein product [Polarella glacialis]